MRLIFITIILLISQIAHSQTGKLVYFHSEEFEEVYTYRAYERIIKQDYSNGILKIKVATIDNCLPPNKGSYKIKNDTIYLDYAIPEDTVKTIVYDSINKDTLIVEEISYTLLVSDTYFELDYEIEGIENKNYTFFLKEEQIKLNDKKYMPAYYEHFINNSGQKDSVLLDDDEGYSYENYIDYNTKTLLKQIKSGYFNKDYFYSKTTEYFPTRKIKKETENFYSRNPNLPDKATIKEWDDKGNLIYEKTK